jgi:hypothetical protein
MKAQQGKRYIRNGSLNSHYEKVKDVRKFRPGKVRFLLRAGVGGDGHNCTEGCDREVLTTDFDVSH